MSNQKQIHKTLQVLLWLWFGVITSFTAVNVVNIAKLETQVEILGQDNQNLQSSVNLLKYYLHLK
jgi:hypothetical protein